MPTNTTDEEEGCDKMKTLYDYVSWILSDQAASDIAMELSMATMPVIIALQAQALLDEMRCYDRSHPQPTFVARPEAVRLTGGGQSARVAPSEGPSDTVGHAGGFRVLAAGRTANAAHKRVLPAELRLHLLHPLKS